MNMPETTDYVKLQDDVIEELRKRKLEAVRKQYPNKKIIVTKDMRVFIEK